uniref:Uncharacterized protein n=1 Tax=Tetraselmis sp. GSL018 TaxID=582737 RepID=A0A061S0R7_9CHLO|mmetsp:Transcript_31366/g.74542  ORF Transcript_31366/g.74542 Transcript_31366/m.74542 type:complete len:293 (-) Transcript_31366:57-935(-)
MRLTPIAAEEWEPRTDTKGAAPLGPEEIGAQVRAELQNTEVNRLKLSHLDLSRQNESLRMENRRIAAEARKEIREAQGGVSVLRQQLYRAQALLRSRVVLTLNGLQKHAPDVNSALSFPREPPRSRNSPKKPVRIPLGHATGNADLFQDESLALGKAQPSGDVFSAEGGEEEGTGSSCHVKQPSHLHRRWNNVTDMYASTPSYNPSTASCVKVQYDVRDILEEAKQRTDAAVNEAEAFGALCNNIHRNHVRQVLSAAADASLSHGMDFFCKIFLEKMEDSVREAANEALGVT